MKKINLLYIAVPLVLLALVFSEQWVGRQSMTFFGIAETDELDIRLEHPIQIEELLVISGQEVQQGDQVAKVSRSDLPGEKNRITSKIEELQLEESKRKRELRAEIRRLESEKVDKITKVQGEIDALKAEVSWDKKLVDQLETVSVSESAADAPILTKIKALEDEKIASVQPLEVQIQELQAELEDPDSPIFAQIRKLENDLKFIGTEEASLELQSPIDGIVGSVNHRDGERLPSFQTLLTIYASRPNIIKGYVHENLIVHVSMGDSVKTVSTLDASKVFTGTVVGLGARIVEIPERLRKLPDLKTYGREVLIEIPVNNSYLQKEKVYLTLLKEGTPISEQPPKPKPFKRKELSEIQ